MERVLMGSQNPIDPLSLDVIVKLISLVCENKSKRKTKEKRRKKNGCWKGEKNQRLFFRFNIAYMIKVWSLNFTSERK